MIARAFAREVALALAIAIVAGALLVTLLQTLRLSPIAAAAGASGGEWLSAMGAAFVLALEAVSPAAFAVAVVLTAIRWQASGEILGARAAGLGTLRLWSGPARVAVLAAVLAAVLSLFAGPPVMRYLEAILRSLVPRALAGAVRPGAVVEIVPGVHVYAARRADRSLQDVMVATDRVVLAARRARVDVAGGTGLVIDARRGELWRQPVTMRFDRLVLPLDLEAAVRSGLAALPRASRSAYGAQRRSSAPLSFLLVALLVSAAALTLPRRPGWLVTVATLLVGGREVLIRAGETAQASLGAGLAAWLPVGALLALGGGWLAFGLARSLAARRG